MPRGHINKRAHKRGTIKRLWRRQEFLHLFRSRRLWERTSGLISIFAMTGWLDDEHPQSLLLVSDPGQGKTELLLRLHGNNPWLSYQADLTVRSFYPLLRLAHRGLLTHIVAVEFQKYFQRKASTSDLLIGTLGEAMAEGVGRVGIGGHEEDFYHAHLGLIGAMTYGTLEKKQQVLKEMGLLSRTATVPWELEEDEIELILHRLTHGNRQDLAPIVLPSFEKKQRVLLPQAIGLRIKDYVWHRWRKDSLRPITRFRSLVKGTALLLGRKVVRASDWEIVRSYTDSTWAKMIEG